MTSRDFCYWLQGFLELRPVPKNDEGLPAHAVRQIQTHLAMVLGTCHFTIEKRHNDHPGAGYTSPTTS